MKKCLLILCVTVFIVSCRNTDKSAQEDIVDEKKIGELKENDTLSLQRVPEGLNAWMNFFRDEDKDFTIGHFKASGVSLHFGDLPDAIELKDPKSFEPYFIFSPDSTRYLDLFSYDHFIDNGKMIEGEADQQVVLADRISKSRKQLLFSGPSQSIDFADWTGKDSFILGITNTGENGKTIEAQLMLFRITDSTFTNFDLDHSVQLDSIVLSGQKFSDIYLNQLKKR